MKAIAKMVDEYTDRIGKIRSKLGNDRMLAEVNKNLQQLSTQFGESRAILNTAGELLIKNVESYNSVETRQVKKVDAMKAHNRDFYKNPVAVASAGGASAVGASDIGATASGTAADTPAVSATTMNYTDNSVNNYYNTPAQPEVTTPQTVQPITTKQQSAVKVSAASTGPAMSTAAKAAVGAGAAGVVAAGSIIGAREVKKRKDKQEILQEVTENEKRDFNNISDHDDESDGRL